MAVDIKIPSVGESITEGTGPRGRITEKDVLGYKEEAEVRPQTAAAAPPARAKEEAPELPPGQRETRQRMSSIRQRIAERLVAAQQTAAMLTTFNEADLSAVLALRSRYKESFQKKHGVGLGFMSFFVKACVEALRAFPAVNASIDGADIVYQHYYHFGVAVSTEKGVLVPVLRDCDQLSFAGVEKGIALLAQK